MDCLENIFNFRKKFEKVVYSEFSQKNGEKRSTEWVFVTPKKVECDGFVWFHRSLVSRFVLWGYFWAQVAQWLTARQRLWFGF